MNTEEISHYIDEYFRRGLAPAEEAFLFSTLAANPDARSYFKEQSILKAAFRMAEDPYPPALDEQILRHLAIRTHRPATLRWNSPVVYGFATLVLAFGFMVFTLFSRVDAYRSQVDNAMVQIRDQQNTIELLMNGLPTVQVTSNRGKTFMLSNN